MNAKNLKNIRAKIKNATASVNQSIDNEYISDADKNKKQDTEKSKNESIRYPTEKSMDNEISFNITPDEDDIKKDLNKIKISKSVDIIAKNNSNRYSKIKNLNYMNIPLDFNKYNESIFFYFYKLDNKQTISNNKDLDEEFQINNTENTLNNETHV